MYVYIERRTDRQNIFSLFLRHFYCMSLEDFENNALVISLVIMNILINIYFVLQKYVFGKVVRPGWHWSIQIEGWSSQTNETQNNF